MGYEYTYRGVRVTSPSGLGALVRRFLEDCRDPAVSKMRLSLQRGDEAYSFESVDEMLASRVPSDCETVSLVAIIKSGEMLSVYSYRDGRVIVAAEGMEDDPAKRVVRSAEKALGLEAIPVEPTPDRSAFVAHSFDDAGKLVAGAVGEFLGLLGFRVVTGEAYSPRGVSSKIKERIREQGIAVCILTRRRGAGADRRRTSQWVLDEATVAETLEKPVFLLIEKGVEAEIGIHGDTENIPFTMRSLQVVIIKLLQGLRELGYQFAPED